MASKIEIINAALVGLGADTISSITDETENARKANAIWDISLREVLSSGQFSFAIFRDELSVTTTTPEFDFMYQYTLPADCIKVVKTSNDPNPYAIEGQYLVTDDATCSIKYIKYISDTAQFTTPFVTALTTYLMAVLCFPITGKADLAKMMMEQYRLTLRESKTKDSQQGTQEQQPTSDWFSEREYA